MSIDIDRKLDGFILFQQPMNKDIIDEKLTGEIDLFTHFRTKI